MHKHQLHIELKQKLTKNKNTQK